MTETPPHISAAIRRWIKLSLIGFTIGMVLGIWWTDYRQKIRFGDVPRAVEDGKIRLELPAGLNFEAGLKLKLSHGHTMLILGLLPVCFAASLHLALVHGSGKPPSEKAHNVAFWLYAAGAAGTVAIIVYRGYASLSAIRSALEAGEALNLAEIQTNLFGGSRALKGAVYGTTHTLLAVGLGMLVHQLWKMLGKGPRPTAAAPTEAARPE